MKKKRIFLGIALIASISLASCVNQPAQEGHDRGTTISDIGTNDVTAIEDLNNIISNNSANSNSNNQNQGTNQGSNPGGNTETQPSSGTSTDGTNPSGTNPSGTNPGGANPSGSTPTVSDTCYYKVKHQLEDANGEYFTIANETLSAKKGEKTNAVAKTYNGYNVVPFEQVDVAANGSTIVTIKYSLAKYTISLTEGTKGGSLAGDGEYSIIGGKAVLTARPYIGYEFDGWYQGDTCLSNKLSYTLDSTEDMNITGKFKIKSEFKDYDFKSDFSSCTVYGPTDPYLVVADIPEGVTDIAEGAFVDSYIKFLNLPKSLKTVGMDAFSDCDYLLKVIVNSHISVGMGAFNSYNSDIPELYDLGGNDLKNYYAFEYTKCHESLDEESVFETYDDKYVFGVGEDNLGNKIFRLAYYYGDEENVVLPETIYYKGITYYSYDIFAGAFINNKNIRSLTIPEAVNEIGSYAFKECVNLVEIFNNSNLDLNIGEWQNGYVAYYAKVIHANEGTTESTIKQSGIYDYYLEEENNVTYAVICNYRGDMENVVIDQIENYPTKICDRLFYENSSIKTVKINEGVVYVGADAFNNCPNLETLDAKYVLEIGDHAFVYSSLRKADISSCKIIQDSGFAWCFQLRNVKMDSVETISEYAFQRNYSLYQVTLPSTLKTLEEAAFSETTHLIEVINKSNVLVENDTNVGITNAHIITNEADTILVNSKGQIKVLIDETNNGYKLVAYDGDEKDIVIDNDVISISEYAFAYLKLNSLVIQNSETYFNYDMLYHTSIKHLEIPLNDNICNDTTYFKNLFVYSDGYYSEFDPNIEELVITGELTEIPYYYFYEGYFDIKAFVFPDTLQSVSRYALNTQKIEKVYFNGTFSDWVTIQFGDYYSNPFSEYSSPELYLIDENGDVEIAGNKYTKLDTLEIPSGATAIPSNQFKYYNMTKVIIPEGVTEIGSGAFYKCKNLVEVVLPSTLKYIDSQAFEGCIKLEKITLPNGLESIDTEAFYNTAIKKITVPKSVTYLGEGVFSYCNSLISATINADLDIPESLFESDYNLQGVNINGNTESIYSRAFYGCKSLRTIKIPNEVSYIGNSAFYSSGIISLDLSNTSITSINRETFYNATYLSNIILPNTVTSIDSMAFYNTKLTSITLDESINSIGYGAFQDNKYLKNVVINGNPYLDDYVFYGCKSLTDVTLPTNITSIPRSMFENCSSLATINLPDTVEVIGASAFANCTMLKDITLSDSITSIDVSSFKSCNRLDYNKYEGGLYLKGGDNSYKYLIGLESNVTEVTINPNVVLYADNLFNSTSIEKLVIPSEITSVPNSLLKGASQLKELELPIIPKSGSEYRFYLLFGTAASNVSSSLKKVTLNSGTTVGAYAFQGCTKIEEIIVPNDITEIGRNAFCNTGLKSFVAPSTLKVIGQQAFYNCRSLESADLSNMNMSNSGSSISTEIFKGCEKLTSFAFPQNIKTITSEFLSGAILLDSFTIPSTVTTIDNQAFYNCGIKNITIPSTVTKIGSKVFSYCESLEEANVLSTFSSGFGTDLFSYCDKLATVSLPNGITTIPDSTFTSCKALTEVELPDNVTSIGKSAFNSSGLQSIVIKSKVTSIGNFAFNGCYSLYDVCNLSSLNIVAGSTSYGNVGYYAKTIHTDPNVRAFFVDVEDKFRFLVDSGEVYLIKYIGSTAEVESLILPSSFEYDNVTYDKYSIDYEVFNGKTFYKNLVIPASVTSIGKDAFKGSYAESITFEGDYIDFADGAFQYSHRLKSVTLPSGNYGDSAFYYSTSLESVSFKSSTNETIIGSNMFNNCTKLKTVELANNVKSIGSSAFYYCNKLVSIVIPDSVETIGSSAFSSCSSLATVTIKDTSNLKTIGANAFNVPITEINLPNSLKSIGANAFSSSKLTTITIPASVTSIGKEAFYGCIIESAVINCNTLGERMFINCSKLTNVTFNGTITSIPKEMFYGCSLLTTLDLPSTVTEIGDSAFYGCGFVSLTIPSAVTKIGSAAFSSCANLESIEILGNVTELKYSTFASCKKLTSVTLPDSIKTFGNTLFSSCSSLETIELPESLTTLGNSTFASCTKLKSVTFKNSVTTFGTYTFSYCSSLETIVLPESLKTMGEKTFYYCSSLKNVTLPESLEAMGQSIFYRCTSLENVILPSKITQITYQAFYECTSLHDYVIPSTIKSIGEEAFRGCTGLDYILIPENVTSISQYAFMYCSGLKRMDIMASIPSLPQYGFTMCTSLETLVLASNIKSVGTSAFGGDSALKNVYWLAESGSLSISESTYYHNTEITNATKYLYSETEPTDTDNKYWHYVDNEPTPWTTE